MHFYAFLETVLSDVRPSCDFGYQIVLVGFSFIVSFVLLSNLGIGLFCFSS
jgi:hypothetical protein